MKFKIIIFTLVVLFYHQGKAQHLQIDSVQACIGDTAYISINMTAIDSAGAITLYIGYDTTKLEFINLTNINVLASGTMFNDVHAGTGGPRLGKIAVSWVTNGSSVNFNAGIFARLKFKVLAGNSPINFLNNCEIANYFAQIITTNFLNGSLTVPAIPVIATQPSQLSLHTSENGFFTIAASNVDSIQWQIKQGNAWVNIQNNATFQGFNKDTLFVFLPVQSLNGVYFRCIVSNHCVTAQSDSAILNVSILSISNNKLSGVKISPNPFSDFISIELPHSVYIEELNIFQIDGKIVKKITEFGESTNFSIPKLAELEKGIYFLQILMKNKEGLNVKSICKMIKN